MPRALRLGDRVRLVLGGPIFRVARVVGDTVRLTPEVSQVSVRHYGRRFSVTAEGMDVSTRFVPAELLEHKTSR